MLKLPEENITMRTKKIQTVLALLVLVLLFCFGNIEEKTAQVKTFQSNKDAIGIRMWIDIPNDFPWRKCLSDYNGVLASTECHLYR